MQIFAFEQGLVTSRSSARSKGEALGGEAASNEKTQSWNSAKSRRASHQQSRHLGPAARCQVSTTIERPIPSALSPPVLRYERGGCSRNMSSLLSSRSDV